MTFMHFEAMSIVAGADVITLSGTLVSPNTALSTPVGGTATAGWNFAGTDSGSIEAGSANRLQGTAYTQPKPLEWTNNKDFVRQFWIRARHDPGATGDSAWGTTPSSGPTLNTWHNLDPGGSNSEWIWQTTSTTVAKQGVIEVSIAADQSGGVGTILATGYYKGYAKVTASGGGGGGGCFTGNMRILMADGTSKCIRDMLVGDMVKSYNERTGELENVRVNGTMVPRVCDIYKVELSNGKTIETTIEHPFRTTDSRWVNIDPVKGRILEPAMTVDCAKMETGMILQGADGNARVVRITDTGRKETVYHLYDVGPNNNFFVEGMCVHNVESEKF